MLLPSPTLPPPPSPVTATPPPATTTPPAPPPTYPSTSPLSSYQNHIFLRPLTNRHEFDHKIEDDEENEMCEEEEMALFVVMTNWVEVQVDYEDSRFTIKCEGKEMRYYDGTRFETDNLAIGPASYYVTDSNKWAVSNAGMFAEGCDPVYIRNTLSQITGTLDSELVQTARISPGSLRYYGFGLENEIYSISLQFAEIGYHNQNTRT
ncbi:hypothetical protein Scep_012331 [Stephania cephalantha]|uniref:Malectin domain-containing protein n=1 Tax=Stephania cephalantha TaxID=152367 RepID=A0AAP0P6M1_9MAGN